ncbi:MAG TPA: RecX family transcriptional regulator [Deinococcales bacterium]|nr:RecX family transcriptional regulator [Deinococcales bacterium]
MRGRRRSAPAATGSELDPEKAFAYAVRALAQKSLTEKELTDRLRRRGANPATVAGTLERLRDYGFVNDAALAARSAEEARVGVHAIRARLKARGLDEHTIEDALSGRDPDLDVEGARALVERYGAKWAGERAYSKGYAFLARRGFPSVVIAEALADLRRRASPEDLAVEEEEP